jgi:hypothetical protein
MEIQQQKLSALLASNVSTLVSSQKNAKPQFLSASPTSIITVITNSSYGIAIWALHVYGKSRRLKLTKYRFNVLSVGIPNLNNQTTNMMMTL